ncbi:MAG: hypothetical protein AAF970_11405 [Bacteroidota bacterium]
MHRRLTFLFLMLLAAGSVEAQWIEAPGRGWVQVSLFHQDTRTRFDERAERRDFFADGHAVTSALYVTGAVGLVRGLDAWVQVPLQRLQFDDVAGERERLGLGDPRIYLRAGPALLGLRPVPIAIRVGVKLPGGDFPVDANVIPLGEGQRDVEVLLEVGHADPRGRWYVAGWSGYRWRFENAEAARTPGHEVVGFVNAGASLRGPWHARILAEGWRGRAPLIQGLRIPSARQALLQVTPTLGWDTPWGTLDAGVRVPVAGRNLPAGATLTVGFFRRW